MNLSQRWKYQLMSSGLRPRFLVMNVDYSRYYRLMMIFRTTGGVVMILAGLVLTCMPDLVSDAGASVDTYELIERRILWGGLAGLGAFTALQTRLRPWSLTLLSVISWVISGLLLARLVGLALDGSHVRQWIWVAVEVVVVAIAAALYVRQKRVISGK